MYNSIMNFVTEKVSTGIHPAHPRRPGGGGGGPFVWEKGRDESF